MENNKTKIFFDGKQVLVFNRARTLIAVFRSIRSAAMAIHCNPTGVSFACIGRAISSGGFYFRHLHPDVYVEIDDLDKLSLEEYDRLCNNNRQYHTIREMVRREESDIKLRTKKSKRI